MNSKKAKSEALKRLLKKSMARPKEPEEEDKKHEAREGQREITITVKG